MGKKKEGKKKWHQGKSNVKSTQNHKGHNVHEKEEYTGNQKFQDPWKNE